jgi:hypothetical protein
MLDSVVLTRGQVWMSPEIRTLVGVDQDEDHVGFAVFLEETLQETEIKADRREMPKCA